MPVCCRCNGSGKCRNCSCSRSGKNCVDCQPSKRQRCVNTREHHDHAAPDNTAVATDPQTQQALNGDGEESRQGGTANDGVGNVVDERRPKSQQQVKEWVSQPCLSFPLHVPPTLPTCGAALMGPQCATRSLPARVKSSIGREMFSGFRQGRQGRPL